MFQTRKVWWIFYEWFPSFIILIWCFLSLMAHQAVNYHCFGNNLWQKYGVGANDRDFFYIYIDIIARLHKERRYLIIKTKKIEKKLDWTWPPRTKGFFSIQRESRLPQKTYITKSPQCAVWKSSRFVWPSMSSQCMEVAQARRVTGRVDGQLPPS